MGFRGTGSCAPESCTPGSHAPEKSRARNQESRTPGSPAPERSRARNLESPAPERSRARNLESCARNQESRNRVSCSQRSCLLWPARSRTASRGYARGIVRGYARGIVRGYARGIVRGYARGIVRGYARGIVIGACSDPDPGAARPAPHHGPGNRESLPFGSGGERRVDDEPTSPCPPPPAGRRGDVAAPACSPSPPLGAERAGVRWGRVPEKSYAREWITSGGERSPRPPAGSEVRAISCGILRD